MSCREPARCTGPGQGFPSGVGRAVVHSMGFGNLSTKPKRRSTLSIIRSRISELWMPPVVATQAIASRYNSVHPHKALGYRSPREFRTQLIGEMTEDAVGAVRRSHGGTPATETLGSRPKPPRRWRTAPALTRAQPWTTLATTPCPVIRGQLHRSSRDDDEPVYAEVPCIRRRYCAHSQQHRAAA